MFGAPEGSQNGAILTHGNDRYGHYKNFVFQSKIEKCKQFFETVEFWTLVGVPHLGQPSRKDESNPQGRFLNFTIRVL